MQLLNPLRPYLMEIDAYAQSLKLWVLDLVAWLAVLLDSRMGRIEVQKMTITARRDLRALIFLKMVARLRLVRRDGAAVRAQPSPSASRGFRVVRRSLPAMKVLTRSIRLKSLDDMKRVLHALDAVVERALARRPRNVRRYGIVAVAPPAFVLASCALDSAPDAADTS